LPFVSEAMYQNLERSNGAFGAAHESVHHCDWPVVDELLLDRALLADMATARQVVALGHSTRSAAGLKVRQPLAKAIIVVPDAQRASVEHLREIIADELNVKTVELAQNEAELVTYKLLPDNKKLGPKFGAKFPQVRRTLDEIDAAQVVARVRSGRKVTLRLDGESFDLAPDEILIRPQPRAGLEVASEAGVVVALDTALTPDLVREGLARDVVRRVQELRKQAGFDIADHIVTTVRAEGDLRAAVEAWRDYIKSETLSDELRFDDPQAGALTDTDSLDGMQLLIGVSRV
jgi:isoleucyl-tRNA synthetase